MSLDVTLLLGALGSAVVHFLWQGALIGLATGLALGALRQHAAETRYAVAFGALAACLLTFMATLALAFVFPGGAPSESWTGAPASTGGAPGALLALSSGSLATRVAAWCWLAGVLCMLARALTQCLAARRLRCLCVSQVESGWQRAFERLKAELGVARGVGILRSGLAEVPMVVGWFAPVVLVPVSAFTALSPEHLRALVAHELAHVRRHDPLFNLLQVGIEIVLFFHPAVWWISQQVRAEREYCCDASSVRLTGHPKRLAEALAALESLRISDSSNRTVLAANGGPLMQRIERILGTRTNRRTIGSAWQLPAGLLLAGVLAVAAQAQERGVRPAPEDKPQVSVLRKERAPLGERLAELELHEERVKGALERGEISNEEAHAALQEIRARLHHAELETRVRRAVEAGEMTQAQARERLEVLEQHLTLSRLSQHLDARVAAGEMTRAEAVEELAGLRRSTALHEELRAEGRKVHAELGAAVAAGKITEAQAKERFEGWLAQIQARADVKAEADQVMRRLDAAVAAGELTEAEARERLAAFHQAAKERSALRRETDPVAVIQKIQAAVEAGKLTPAEGKAKIEALREQMARSRAPRPEQAELDGLRRRIEQGIEAGRLTPEQGKMRLEQFEQELEQRRRELEQQRKELERPDPGREHRERKSSDR